MELIKNETLEKAESSQILNQMANKIKKIKETELTEEDKAWQENAYLFLV